MDVSASGDGEITTDCSSRDCASRAASADAQLGRETRANVPESFSGANANDDDDARWLNHHILSIHPSMAAAGADAIFAPSPSRTSPRRTRDRPRLPRTTPVTQITADESEQERKVALTFASAALVRDATNRRGDRRG